MHHLASGFIRDIHFFKVAALKSASGEGNQKPIMGNDTEAEFILLDPDEGSFVNPSFLTNQLCVVLDDNANFSLRLNESVQVYCPKTFDGWSCWNATPAGEHAFQPCPSFVPGFDFARMAHKYCTPEGTWYRHPATNKTWSNYTTCIDNDDLRFRQSINNLYIIGYSISVSALVISLAIFCAFRSLRCTRIYIHKNLFSSFIFNNVMWIIWYTTIVKRPDVLLHSAAPCIILHILVQYSLVSNYLWMFCEGLYLHTLLVVAFVKEERLMCWLYVIGWGLPALLTLTYTTVRATAETSDLAYCWILESASVWILSGPVCFSMLLNLFFLINIVRVLVTKLRAVNNNTDSNNTKKAVRATLILIPLLGLHYVITPFRPEPRSPGEALYETVSATVTSFQGFCVSLLFCFFNGEILGLVRRRWRQTRMIRHEDLRFSKVLATTVTWDDEHTTL